MNRPVVAAIRIRLLVKANSLRWIALHLIEETARHTGHLDAVRELLDGTTGLGPR